LPFTNEARILEFRYGIREFVVLFVDGSFTNLRWTRDLLTSTGTVRRLPRLVSGEIAVHE
jgi:hypothetical protein